MATIATSADGEVIFLALENSSGFPVIISAARDDLATFAAVYNPGAGSAGGVLASGDPDTMFFYGYFGSGVQLIRHIISTGVNTNVSPTGLTTKFINAAAVNPADSSELWVTVNTDQDLLHTIDQGTTWETLNAALGINPTALLVRPGSEEEPPTIYLAGNNGTTVLMYTPNEGTIFASFAGATLGAAANVVGLEYAAEA